MRRLKPFDIMLVQFQQPTTLEQLHEIYSGLFLSRLQAIWDGMIADGFIAESENGHVLTKKGQQRVDANYHRNGRLDPSVESLRQGDHETGRCGIRS